MPGDAWRCLEVPGGAWRCLEMPEVPGGASSCRIWYVVWTWYGPGRGMTVLRVTPLLLPVTKHRIEFTISVLIVSGKKRRA